MKWSKQSKQECLCYEKSFKCLKNEVYKILNSHKLFYNKGVLTLAMLNEILNIDGLEHTRRDALSAIRYQLDEIHGSIKGLDVKKRVPIPEAPNAEPLDYDYLLQLERDGFEELPVKDGSRLVVVNVRKLLSGIESEAERKQNVNNMTKVYVSGDVHADTFIAGNENQASISNSGKKPKQKKS